MGERVFVYDTTLRDGAQQEGINLSVADKLALLPYIEQMGADYIEGGWPGAIPRDTEFFEQLKASNPLTTAKLTAFGSTRKTGTSANSDAQVLALLASGADVLCLVAKSDIRHVNNALRTTGEENLAMIRDTVEFLRSQGREVMIDAEHFFDGYDYDPNYTASVVIEAFAAGASWVVLCDTNGGSLPDRISRTVADLRSRLTQAGFPDAHLGIHTHDDGGCAVANSIAAVEAGCRQVQGTINGYGERTGNANLLTVVANLQLKTNFDAVSSQELAGLSAVAHAVAEITTITPSPRQPYVGASAFAHKAGLHASAIRVDPGLYQHIDPDLVGNNMRMLVSDMAGRASIELKAKEFGVDLSEDRDILAAITNRVKEAEAEGYTYDAADASFEMMVREILTGAPLEYFEVESWSTSTSTDRANVEETYAEATVKIHAGGRRLMRVGEGVGPVDALDDALRTALKNVYPELEHIVLTDFKVRILDSHKGTQAVTRVMITLSDGESTWTTVGLGDDVIEASWEALTDGYVYGLFRGGVHARL
ncbi:MAG: citramalate synthase [Actinomycetaceae bacterium]|nr:citramalate synthase [Arcanobacterium sp.]MDD7504954.1 citramalate synthase [Actinomycetaceae bacterium]MDY6143705.1 citramalate synthase [Arcanobacterium sp.]